MFYTGTIWFVSPDNRRYPLRGMDISHHQGEIDWRAVPRDKVYFAYIKATEGGDFQDPNFFLNWYKAQEFGIPRGAYHFFTNCRNGTEQAINFKKFVPMEEDSLPPVLDAEVTADCPDSKRRIDVSKEISIFIKIVTNHFRRPVMIYTTQEFMQKYPLQEFNTNIVWIRSLLSEPRLSEMIPWRFWQYTNRGRIPGVSGYVDLNAFRGTEEEFWAFVNALP